MNFALNNWYVPKTQRNEWLENKEDRKQMEYTNKIPNLDKIEIDNIISPGCTWGANATIKVIGWNAGRGTHWDKFYTKIEERDELRGPLVILINEMDIGIARSGNVHTSRRLVLQLGMNYAYGVEVVELTRGIEEEQNRIEGKRDALSLHGNTILSKCILGDGLILRDPLPYTYFAKVGHEGVNAEGYEVRLGGRMELFARIFEKPSPVIPRTHNLMKNSFHIPEKLPSHFVVGNVHKVAENRAVLWNFFGFGAPAANSTSIYDGNGIDLASSQHGVIVQGQFGSQFCFLGGIRKGTIMRFTKHFPPNTFRMGNQTLAVMRGFFLQQHGYTQRCEDDTTL